MREVNQNLPPSRSYDFTHEDDEEHCVQHTGYPDGAGYLSESYRTDSILGQQAHAQVLPVADNGLSYMAPRVNALHTSNFSHVQDTSLNTSGASPMPISSQSFSQSSSLAYGAYADSFHQGLPGFQSCNQAMSQFHGDERYLQSYGLPGTARVNNMADNCTADMTSGSESASPNSVNSSTVVPAILGAEQYMPPTPSSVTSTHHRPRRSIPKEEPLPFRETEVLKQIICESKHVKPEIQATVAKNVFNVENTWTCYRRNYISVECSFTLEPNFSSGRLYLMSDGDNLPRLIQAFAIKLDGKCDGAEGKEIELVQHTAKRDKGIKSSVEMKKLGPDVRGHNTSNFATQLSPPILPLQYEPDDRIHGPLGSMTTPSPLPVSSQQTRHTFERIQFKSATANNGRRRAQQQYYHLVPSLWADVRPSHADKEEWVKVAHRVSHPMVVRGRSPGHYTDTRSTNDSSGGFGGPGGSGSQGGPGSLGLGHGTRPGSRSSRGALSTGAQANNVQMLADGATTALQPSHSGMLGGQHTNRIDSSSHFVSPSVLSQSDNYNLTHTEVPYLMKPPECKDCDNTMLQGAEISPQRHVLIHDLNETYEPVWARKLTYENMYSDNIRSLSRCGRLGSYEPSLSGTGTIDLIDTFPHTMYTSMA